jgi:hypothetical protein
MGKLKIDQETTLVDAYCNRIIKLLKKKRVSFAKRFCSADHVYDVSERSLTQVR